jgi:hypothetical protein
MAKFVWLVALALLGRAGAAAETTMKNEPKDFRGIEWGAPIEQYASEMILLRRENDVTYYRRKADRLNIGQAEAIKIAYRFYKDRFSAGVVQTFGGSNQKSLIGQLLDSHGEPIHLSQRIQQYMWQGEGAFVILTCEVSSYCAAEFISRQVNTLEQAETGVGVEQLMKKKEDDGDGDDSDEKK